MRIGEVARQVGVNPKTIPYYESIGPLPEPAPTASGYRDYGPDDVDRIAFARRATELDLHLDEIATILALRVRGERPCDFVLEVARRRVDELGDASRRWSGPARRWPASSSVLPRQGRTTPATAN